jgi:hypothetical protein
MRMTQLHRDDKIAFGADVKNKLTFFTYVRNLWDTNAGDRQPGGPHDGHGQVPAAE